MPHFLLHKYLADATMCLKSTAETKRCLNLHFSAIASVYKFDIAHQRKWGNYSQYKSIVMLKNGQLLLKMTKYRCFCNCQHVTIRYFAEATKLTIAPTKLK